MFRNIKTYSGGAFSSGMSDEKKLARELMIK